MINKFKENGLEFIRVTNTKGLNVTLCSLGASIFNIEYLGLPMTYSPKNIEDFLRKDVYHGKTIGRVAGRITGNKLTIDGSTYVLDANEKGNVLHGGSEGLSTKTFDVQVISNIDNTEVIYSYLSKDKESGFPGDAKIEVRYIIYNDESTIKLELSCKVSKKCPISLTNHSYFCLGDSNINNLCLKVNSSRYVLMNNYDLTLKGCLEVPPYLDFRNSKHLIDDINTKEMNECKLCGYDHVLLLDKENTNKPQVILENDKFKLDISTDLDTVVIYSDNYEAGFVANNSNDKIRRGLAIEPQLNPLNNRVLNANEAFKHKIIYSFKTK